MYNLNKITQSSDEYKIYERNISIDIIKTIAIFLIIMSHVLPLGYIKSGGGRIYWFDSCKPKSGKFYITIY